MDRLLWVALAGFAASLVDGALGMGFGPTSSSILLTAGLTPVTTSTMVNLAKIVSGLAGGAAHWRAGNVDRKLVVQLAVPGVVGAVIGTLALTRVEASTIRPVMAVLLLLVGIRLLVRFAARPGSSTTTDTVGATHERTGGWGLRSAALTGGVTNGMVGAWGPVVTPYLLHRRVDPRIVVGSVNTAEIVVALVSAVSLIGSIGTGSLDPQVLVAMLVGGVIAAPLSAYVVRLIAARTLGLAMAGLLLITQTREIAAASGVPILAAIGVASIAAIVVVSVVARRKTRIEQMTQVRHFSLHDDGAC